MADASAKAPGLTVARVAAALALIGVGIGLAPLPASAWSEGACPTATGVTVVIDFQELGGGTFVRCATGQVTTSFGALESAGIDYQTAIRSSGFLCRIAGLPTDDPCINPSPATAYWSYWLAPRGGGWCFSNRGAGNRTPAQGTVEAWSFSLDKSSTSSPPPRIDPPAAVAGSPTRLPDRECDQASAAPKPPEPGPVSPPSPPTAPRATAAPPGPAMPSAPAQPGGPTPRAPGLAVAGAETDRAGTGTGTASASTSPLGAKAVPVDPSANPDAVASPTDSTTSTSITSTTTNATENDSQRAAATIDLSGGSSTTSSPLGVVFASTLVAALAGGAFWYRRRIGRV